jgi:uncharacterized protein (DUF302 family)
MMADTSYGFTTRLRGVTFEKALEATTEALKSQGFGVLTEIDVKETMKKKLNVDFRKYKILGACNPPLAHKALSADLYIGLLLPCNVTVFEEDDGAINVSVIKPEEMFKVVQTPGVEGIAAEVTTRVRAVITQVQELAGRPA